MRNKTNVWELDVRKIVRKYSEEENIKQETCSKCNTNEKSKWHNQLYNFKP